MRPKKLKFSTMGEHMFEVYCDRTSEGKGNNNSLHVLGVERF
ncbi:MULTISPECIES: hypothetical protein [Tolypothrix]|nr:hypothetical protein [Tolypothrix bouteillei]